ncbi:hypothetical protein WOLCODRAFT_140424 [Wolfiporia cocos MD-104 SS10]|uniref:Myosin-binding domain-containing protein n=1 Tax=Wolfiporia cocos (strain MD-104) TaxID=742152 RepID=A0A2H3JIE3_WOLCO|nr:hypothetical protein WOLCODRAFT_140424 [Wolfiporia cocos MD-104 SS10]
MAEPVFEEHPLKEYFRRVGETSRSIPGGSSDFEAQLDHDEVDQKWIGHPALVMVVNLVNALLPSSPSPETAFAERFKYDVISSSLLSTSLAAPVSSTRRSFSSNLPDEPVAGKPEHDDDPLLRTADDYGFRVSSAFAELHWPVVMVSVAVVALAVELYFVAIFLFGGATYIWHASKVDRGKASAMSATLQSVNELISAGNEWDSAINEGFSIIEKEERSIFYSPDSHSPSSSLRVTLQSSLHTTQTQCDNVRQLLSALTDPDQLSQLSEMYAPSSPVKQSFSLLDNPRPVSVPFGRQRTASTPSNKRATWNGSYAALASAGSPTAHLQKRWKQRQSDVSFLLSVDAGAGSSKLPSVSAPASPQFSTQLQDVQEEEDDSSLAPPESPLSKSADHDYFGAEALDLRRKRRSSGMETFGVPPLTHSSHSPRTISHRSSGSIFSPIPPASRLTAVHTTRHPLSLSGLRLALHGSLSAKRYACSHLLALRFEGDEDESYWEDVRSVIALLTSTFEDASARLNHALKDAEKKRTKEELRSSKPTSQPAKTMAEMVSFAPMPSHLTRFAAHVDAISSALNDAREHLEKCVAAIRDTEDDKPFGKSSASAAQEHPAFEAYDKLRKELGFALRECERGRERLLDIVSGPRPAFDADLDAAADGTPGLGRDSESEASDKPGPFSPPSRASTFPALGLNVPLARESEDVDVDDATAHLLLTATSQHLPPPGAEQVYEADTGAGIPFTRPRSKLSREERIASAKARRESSGGAGRFSSLSMADDSIYMPRGEKWGPGGEVVQELKDVIWKVGERRRRLAEQQPSRTRGADLDATHHTPRMTLSHSSSMPHIGVDDADARSSANMVIYSAT